MGVDKARLQALKDIWSRYRVNNVVDHAGQVFLQYVGKPSGGDVYLTSSLDLGQLVVPPLWWVETPRITQTWRYASKDPNDYDVVAEEWGKTSYSHAYTLGLNERGFSALFALESREQFLGSMSDIRGHADLMRMVDKHLKAGRDRQLKSWSRS